MSVRRLLSDLDWILSHHPSFLEQPPPEEPKVVDFCPQCGMPLLEVDLVQWHRGFNAARSGQRATATASDFDAGWAHGHQCAGRQKVPSPDGF